MPSYLDKARQACLRPRGFDALFVGDWTRTMLAITGGLALAFFLFGYWWPYYRIADMDMFVVYEGFLFNDHLPQEFVDHPGYLTILLVGNWFRLLHGLGLLDVHALSELPPAANVPASEQAWSAAIHAGRLLSLAIAESLVGAFGLLLRRLVQDWRVAALGAFAIAFSGGMAMHARTMRTEMLSAGLAVIALLILLIAAERPRSPWRPALIGFAAFLMTLAVLNKLQAIFLICAVPVLLLPFGCRSAETAGFWHGGRRAALATAFFVVSAILIAIPAAPIVWAGLTTLDPNVPVIRWGGMPVYQFLIADWIALGMVVFARLWRVSPLETLAAMAAALGGMGLGLLFLDIRYNPENLTAVLNPLEYMLRFATSVPAFAGERSMFGGDMLRVLFEGFLSVLARLTYVLHTSPRPALVLEWLVIAAAVSAYRAGERKLCLQAAILMAAVWAIDTLGTLRGLKQEYFLFTDPLTIIAAALLVARLKGLQTHRWVFQIGAVFIAVHILVGSAEPVKHSLLTSKPLDFCQDHFHYTRRIERLPFCPS